MKHSRYVIILLIFWTGNLFSQNKDSIQECPNKAILSKIIEQVNRSFAQPDDWRDEYILKYIYNKQCEFIEYSKLGIPYMRDLEFSVMVRNDIKHDCHIRGVYAQQGGYVLGQGFTGPIIIFYTGNDVTPCLCPIDKESKKKIQAEDIFIDEFDSWKRAHNKYKEKDYDGAIIITNKAIIRCPKSASLYGMRAEAKYKLGDYKGALADFTKQNQIYFNNFHSEFDFAIKGCAISKYKLNDTKGACLDYHKAISLGYNKNEEDNNEEDSDFVNLENVCK